MEKKQIYGVKSFLAFVLRHKPFFYKIKLDSDGFANIDFVLKALNTTKKSDVTKEQLIEIARKYSGGIFKVDINSNKIKAKDGHSVVFNMRVPDGLSETSEVPKQLYCLVSQDDVSNLMSSGGITFANKQTLLSSNPPNPIEGMSILTINSNKAKSDSVKFFLNKSKDMYFTRHLSSKYISVHV